MRLGLIGQGSVATLALDALEKALPTPIEALICLARPASLDKAREWAGPYLGRVAQEVIVATTLETFLAARPMLVAEAAGHEALAEAGPAVLEAGIALIVSAVGALADDRLHDLLQSQADASGVELVISPGAIGGLDILAAAKLAGLTSVTYTSRKPPMAWRGTKAEEWVDLDRLDGQLAFFEGSARDAARLFPQNANVAATIALAGVGLDETQVRLVADPAVTRNQHEIDIRSRCTDLSIRIEGHAAPGNPKTSATTGYALAHLILERLHRPA